MKEPNEKVSIMKNLVQRIPRLKVPSLTVPKKGRNKSEWT